jgi:23S rRNA (guanosine2251-2'-O)-methyltransferase
MAVLFGIHSVREALRQSVESIQQCYFAVELSNPRLRELHQWVEERRIPVHQVPEEALQRMAGSAHHQGVVARSMDFQYRDLETVITRTVPPGLLLVLDEIQDPQNLGAILRSSDGAGVSGVFLPKHKAASITSAVIKASAGAALHLPIVRETNLNRTLQTLKENGYWTVGLDVHTEKLWTDYDYRCPTVLVLGNEGRGLRPLIRRNCDELVKIPMQGRVESLNVSAATAVILYEVLRQRQFSPGRA